MVARAGAGAAPRAALLDRREEIYALARELASPRSVLFLGRHAGFPIALEGALKLKELAYIHAEGFAAGELKHGPIALIEDGLPVFCVVPPRGRDQLHDKMVSAIQEVRARGARTIVLAEEGDDEVAQYADVLIRCPPYPRCCSRWSPSCPLQLFACELATADGPRRGPAAQPGQVRHGRVTAAAVIIGVGIDVVDIARFGESLERTPGLRERLFTAARARAAAGVAGRAVRRQGGARQGARRPDGDWSGTTPRCVTRRQTGRRSSSSRGTVAARAAELGAAQRHLSLSHDAGIASRRRRPRVLTAGHVLDRVTRGCRGA